MGAIGMMGGEVVFARFERWTAGLGTDNTKSLVSRPPQLRRSNCGGTVNRPQTKARLTISLAKRHMQRIPPRSVDPASGLPSRTFQFSNQQRSKLAQPTTGFTHSNTTPVVLLQHTSPPIPDSLR